MLAKVLDWLRQLPWSMLLNVLRPIIIRRRWALMFAAALLIAAALLGSWYWHRSKRYEEVVSGTLSKEMTPTPQIYKGLEAFIISCLPPDPAGKLASREFSAPFLEALREAPSALRSADLAAMPNLDVVPDYNGGVVLTDDLKPTFLFLPIQILRPTLTEQQRATFEQNTPQAITARKPLIKRILEDDPELRKDIAFTAAFVPILQRIAETSVTVDTHDRPEQVYVITKNGVNRIFSANPAARQAYQFPEATFFPSRPYFWPAFDVISPRRARRLEEIAPSGGRVQDWFAVSRPYMDLGGAGLVVTISRGILVDGFPRAVLCIDLPVDANPTLPDLLRKRVRSFDGYTMTVTCDVTDTAPKADQCVPSTMYTDEHHGGNDPLLAHMQATLRDRQVRQRRADILGNIIILNTEPNSNTIEASLPLGIGDGKETFLLMSMNLVRFRRVTTWIGMAAAACVALVVLLVFYFWLTQVRYSQDYQKAFDRLALIMADAPTPYVRLNTQDVIRDFNGAFLALLKYTEADLPQVSRMTFRSVLADDQSRKTYDDVEEKRRRQDKVTPYNISLRRSDKSSVTVRIVSAAVPDAKGSTLPETFGILLQPNQENVVPLELRTATRKRADEHAREP